MCRWWCAWRREGAVRWRRNIRTALEGWYAHIPGIKVLTPATVPDAYGMLLAALREPDPVFIFEHATLYPLEGEVDEAARLADITRAAVTRQGRDVTLITYGGTLGKTMQAADRLAENGIEAEVIDLRSLTPARHTTIWLPSQRRIAP